MLLISVRTFHTFPALRSPSVLVDGAGHLETNSSADFVEQVAGNDSVLSGVGCSLTSWLSSLLCSRAILCSSGPEPGAMHEYLPFN